jgi:putative phosphoesterase
MRILLVADVHANWAALEAVRESFDLCLCLGDLVDYGVEPGPCIEWARKHAAHAVRGNHDHGAAQHVVVSGTAGFRYLTGLTRSITCGKLAEPERRYLAGLPLTKFLTLNGKRCLLVHATPRDPMDEFAPADVDFWQRRLEGIDVDFVLCGHTHQPYILQVGSVTVVNPGSVGLPRDGDPRAAYAVFTDSVVELRRAEYPIDRAIQAVHETDLPDKAKEMLAEVYRTGKLPGARNGSGNGVARQPTQASHPSANGPALIAKPADEAPTDF